LNAYKDLTSAEVIADSIWDGVRLTTMRVVMPRIILSEFNTHRTFCLAGDQELEFDLPAGAHGGGRRVHRMSIAEFVDKWEAGAHRIEANPKWAYDYSSIQPSAHYTADEMAVAIGMTESPINRACRQGKVAAFKSERKWTFSGESFLHWRRSKPEHTRFNMKPKLAGMRIRQLNETTGLIQTSTVTGVSRSGLTEIYEVKAGEFTVAGSQRHRVLTSAGWKTIGDLTTDDALIVRTFGKTPEDSFGLRYSKIEGLHRSQWQRKMRAKFAEESPLCRECGETEGRDVHHIESVHVNPSRAFDESNVILLCLPCHQDTHREQGWQGGTYLYGSPVQVDSITYRGTEQAYDLSIAGEFPNFIANGVVVHNSRNSASSRAIPLKRQIELVRESPFVPQQWPKNQAGMQAKELVDNPEMAEHFWLLARADAIHWATNMGTGEDAVHKQIASRLLEPFMWHTVIVSSTEWENFFALRDHEDAQPEMQTLARAMRKALDESTPKRDAVHIPFRGSTDLREGDREQMMIRAVARCARVSYGREMEEKPYEDDVKLVEKLLRSGHLSPFEHLSAVGPRLYAMNADGSDPTEIKQPHLGNFSKPWQQLRHHVKAYLPSIAARIE